MRAAHLVLPLADDQCEEDQCVHCPLPCSGQGRRCGDRIEFALGSLEDVGESWTFLLSDPLDPEPLQALLVRGPHRRFG
jgi:hypothetical protein